MGECKLMAQAFIPHTVRRYEGDRLARLGKIFICIGHTVCLYGQSR